MPKPINEQKLKYGFMLLNQKLQRDRYKQFFFNGSSVVEKDFDAESAKTQNQNTQKKKNV